MALTTVGLTTLRFGTSDQSSSVVKSYEETIKCDPVELISGDGSFKAVAIANPNSSVSITIVSGVVSGNAGGAFSFTGNSLITGLDSLYVESASRTLTNDGFTESQITAIGTGNLGYTS
jgi:hypothetical protein